MCVEAQFLELRQKYSFLFIRKNGDEYTIIGSIFIEKDDIKDRYEIEILVPRGYPFRVPRAKEIGLKIPQNFHHYSDGTLCLEIPLKIHEIFRQKETLLNFVDNLLIPYLYAYSYSLRNGTTPFGEHAHGGEGVLEDYKRRFGILEDHIVLNLLKILAENSYRGHHLCPCGNGKKLRNCHGPCLLEMKRTGFNCLVDFVEILIWLRKEKNFDTAPYVSNKVKNYLDRLKKHPCEKWNY